MCTVSITALNKNAVGTQLRPILRPKVLRCIAPNAVLRPKTQQTAISLGHAQHAIGQPVAAEIIANHLRHHNTAQPAHASILMDATNAIRHLVRESAQPELDTPHPELVVAAS